MSRRSSRTRAAILLRRPAADAEPEGDVVEDVHVAEERVVLEDEADVPLAHRLRR